MSEAQERQAFVGGLRQLADFIEVHAELPLPMPSNHNAFVFDRVVLAAIARTAGVKWNKSPVGGYFALSVVFDGGTTYEVNIPRDQVCRKVITGTRVEPATPEREIETYEWVCDEPLLANS